MSADRYEWMDQASCAQADPDAWADTAPGNGSRLPKRICSDCPVSRECDAHADQLHAYEGLAMHGVWGGRSHRQRTTDRRQQQAA